MTPYGICSVCSKGLLPGGVFFEGYKKPQRGPQETAGRTLLVGILVLVSGALKPRSCRVWAFAVGWRTLKGPRVLFCLS